MKPLHNYKIVLLLMAVFVFLTSCSLGKNPGDHMYQKIEDAADGESTFNDLQKPMVKAENKEHKLFKDIMKLDMTEYKKIKEHADDALKSIEERKDMLKDEQASIEKAYKSFQEGATYISELDDKETQSLAKDVVDIMDQRYQTYQNLHKAYQKSLQLDEKLFNMLKKKDLKVETLQAQIKKVNSGYKKVEKDQKRFNDLTKQFNKKKMDLYKQLGIEINRKDKEGA